jgi:hypothetical protein
MAKVIIICLAFVLLGCQSKTDAERARAIEAGSSVRNPAYVEPYVVTRYTASNITFFHGQPEPHPAEYDIRHGNVLIHAQCWTIDGISCNSFPDPPVAVGQPLLDANRTQAQYLEFKDEWLKNVTLRILSEETAH